MKNQILIALITTLALLVSVLPTYAQSSRNNNQRNQPNTIRPADETVDETEEVTEEDDDKPGKSNNNKQEAKNRLANTKCVATTKKLDKHISQHTSIKNSNTNRYKGIVLRVENAIKRLDAADYDTTEVSAQLELMKEMIAELNDSHNTFLTSLKEAKSVCDEDPAQYRSEVKGAKNQMNLMRKDVMELKQFIKEDLKSAFEDLKSQKTDEDENEEDSTEENTEDNTNEDDTSDDTENTGEEDNTNLDSGNDSSDLNNNL